MADLLRDIFLGRAIKILGIDLEKELRMYAMKVVLTDIKNEKIKQNKALADNPFGHWNNFESSSLVDVETLSRNRQD